MTENPFKRGTLRTMEAYREFKRAHPDCICNWNDYGECLFGPDRECPIHGELNDTAIRTAFGRMEAICERCSQRYIVNGGQHICTTYRPPPDHYSTGTGIDPWAVWDAFDLDRYTANAVKYLLRAGKKGIAPRLDDLKKARDYINKAIEREELNREG